MSRIVVLTGAGISAESGLGTFRDAGGVWTQVRLEDVATPEAFARDPAMVRAFYDARRDAARRAAPNAAHRALAALEAAGRDLLIITQNVDDLHERAGSRNLLHLHGELAKALCAGCGARWAWGEGPMTDDSACPECGEPGGVRPDVVWFGETPYGLDAAYAALGACETFVSIGTSGAVYPAGGFVREARAAGARTLELNLEPSEVSRLFHETRLGPASDLVPAWAAEILGV
ncbi:MAG: NAD-dependent deacylase [Rhodobacteraceae bacterium]|nr:MAG: NAD-dependent deacylase [Paracoccaceae bacterium]